MKEQKEQIYNISELSTEEDIESKKKMRAQLKN